MTFRRPQAVFLARAKRASSSSSSSSGGKFVRLRTVRVTPASFPNFVAEARRRRDEADLACRVLLGEMATVHTFSRRATVEACVEFSPDEPLDYHAMDYYALGKALRVDDSAFSELDLPGLASGLENAPKGGVFELRTYQLVLGYATVPQFHEIYAKGLEDKLATDATGESRLLALLASEAGATPLNTVLELWHHASIPGAQRSRAASREALKWREAISDIAKLALKFDTQFLTRI